MIRPKDMIRRYLCLLALVHALPGLCTHIIGGELNYVHLGGNSYQVVLKLYRDCGPANTNNTGFDNFAWIGVFNGNGTLFNTQNLGLPVISPVPVVIDDPCLVVPPVICVEQGVYTGTVQLPANAQGYRLSYQRCCRPGNIVNIQNSQDQGLTCSVEVPGTPNNVNSSPSFAQLPSVALCVGRELVFDHSAIDPDGDELVYELCAPFHGATNFDPAPTTPSPPPYTPVPWAPGYSVNAMIDASPMLSIDPVTGVLTGTPTAIGYYAVGVCVSEYRNGELLSTVSRDMLFTVAPCDFVTVAAIQEQQSFCEGLTLDLVNESVNGVSYFWNFGDPSTTADTSSLANPSWTYPAPGEYTVTLVANPGWPCSDTSISVFQIFPELAPVFDVPDALCGASEVDLSVTGGFTGAADITWDLGAGAAPSTASGPSVTASFQPLGVQTVTVTVSDYGCTDSYSADVQVFPIPEPAIAPQEDFCTGLTMDFVNQGTGGSAWLWDFGDPGTSDDVSTQFSPSWSYAGTGTYTITLTADPDGPCPASTSAVYDVYLDIALEFDRPAIRCPDQPAEFIATGSFTPAASVTWNFGAVGTPPSATGTQATAQFGTVGVHAVTVSAEENGCFGTYTDSVVVHPFPEALFDSDSQACVGNLFGFTDLSTAWTPLTHSWSFGDGEQSSAAEPSHRYQAPGIYTVSLTVSTDSGCVASDTRTVPGQVVVYPNPIAAFTALPREVTVFAPDIRIEDHAQDAMLWTYDLEGITQYVPSFSHSFQEGGQFVITQVVESEFGCRDSTTRVVFVSDHLFHAPTAFTPDGDGLNDVWLPNVIGARTYQLVIHDRWGREVFTTTDPKQGWDGRDHDQGVYVYTARIKEWGAEAKEYRGHFSLLR